MTKDDLTLAGTAFNNLPKPAFTYDDTEEKALHQTVKRIADTATDVSFNRAAFAENYNKAASSYRGDENVSRDRQTTKEDFLLDKNDDKLKTLTGVDESVLGSLAKELTGVFRGLTDTWSSFQGTRQHDQNKLYNEMSPTTRQEFLGRVSAERQVFRDDRSGTFYVPTAKGNVGVSPRDVGILYSGQTQDGNTKLGYVSNYGAGTNPVDVVKQNYDHFGKESAKRGKVQMDPSRDPNLMAMYLLKKDAIALEAVLHGNEEALKNRAYLVQPKGMARGTEVYKGGDASSYLGSSINGAVADKKVLKMLRDAPKNGKTDLGPVYNFLKETEQTGAGIAAGIGRGAIDLADAAQELVTYLPQVAYNAVADKKIDIDLFDDKLKERMIEGVNKLVNYDATADEEDFKESEESITAAGVELFSPSTWSNLVTTEDGRDALETLITNPSLIAHGVAQIVGAGGALGVATKVGVKGAAYTGAAVAGKPFTKGVPAAEEAIKGALKSTNTKIDDAIQKVQKSTLSPAVKAERVAKLSAMQTPSVRAAHYLQGTKFTNADFANRVNEHITEYKKNNEGTIELPKLASILLVDRALSIAEVYSAKRVLLGPKALSQKEVASGFTTALGLVAADMAKSIGIEAVQEGSDAIFQVINTKYGSEKYKDKTMYELLKADSSEIIASTLLGAAGGGYMSGARLGAQGLLNAGQYAGEKIAARTGFTSDPTLVQKPRSTDGKAQMWKSVGSPGFVVGENPKSREVYAETVAEFVTDLMFAPKAQAKYGYSIADTDTAAAADGKGVDAIFRDGVNKIANIYSLDEEAKEVAEYMLMTKIVNYSRAHNADMGGNKFSAKDRAVINTQMAKLAEGNKAAELAFVQAQKEEIKALFDVLVNSNRTEASVNTADGEPTVENSLMAKVASLSEEQYTSLIEAVQSIKVMGSAESGVAVKLGSIEAALESLRLEGQLLGSSDTKVREEVQRRKKTAAEVSAEISQTGFLLDSGLYKKSISEHAEDVAAFVGTNMPKAEESKVVRELSTFIEHRGIDKVRGFTTNKDGTKRVLFRLAGIKGRLADRIEENNKLVAIVNAKLATLKRADTYYDTFQSMSNALIRSQNAHKTLLKLANSGKVKDRREVYHELQKNLDSNVSPKFTNTLLDQNPGWDTDSRAFDNERALWEHSDAIADINAAFNTVAESEKGPWEELNSELGPEVSEGPNDSSNVITNVPHYISELGTRLAQLKEGAENLPVDDAKFVELHNKYKESFASALTDIQEVITTLRGSAFTGERKDWTPKVEGDFKKGRKKATTAVTRLRNALRDVSSNFADLEGSVLKEEILSLGGSLKTFQDDKKSSLKKEQNATARAKKKQAKDAVPKPLTEKQMMKKAEEEAEKAEAEARKAKAEAFEVKEEARKAAEKAREEKEKRVNAAAKTSRREIHHLLGPFVRPSKPQQPYSLNALLSAGEDVDADTIMHLMPNMVQVKDTGRLMITEALKAFKLFSAARNGTTFTKENTLSSYQWFPTQREGEKPQVNPLKEIKINGIAFEKPQVNPLKEIKINGIAFEKLWVREEVEQRGSKTNPIVKNAKQEAYIAKKERVRVTVKRALNLASAVTLKEMIDMRMSTADLMSDVVDNGFASLWPEYENSDNLYEAKDTLRAALYEGSYVPEAVFRANAGRLLLRELELNLSTKLTVQERPDIEMALGVLVINNILPKSPDTIDETAYETANDIANETVDGKVDGKVPNKVVRGVVYSVDKKLVFERITKNDDAAAQTKSIRVIDLSALRPEYLREIGTMGTVFQFATAQTEGDISFEPIAKKAEDATIRNSTVPLAPEVKEYLDKQGGHAWTFFGLEKYVMSAQDEYDEYYVQGIKEQLLGSLPELVANTQAMDMDSKIAKYRAEELVIDRMLQAHALMGDGRKFYLGWDYIISGRSMITNKLVNPQASGITRGFVAAEDMINTIDTTNIGEEELEHIELALAQAFKIDIDKKNPKAALQELRTDYVHIQKTKTGGLSLEFGHNERLKGLVTDKHFDLGSIRKANRIDLTEMTVKMTAEMTVKMTAEKATKKAAEMAAKMTGRLPEDSKIIMHTVQAVELLREIQFGNKTIVTNLGLEADGITNGMGIMLKQMGWTDYTKDMLGRAGVYLKESKIKTHMQFKAKGGKDIYEAPLAKLETLLEGDTKDRISEIIGGKWRNFMKNPVMIFIYGAGLGNITAAIARSLVVGNSYFSGALAKGKLGELKTLSGLDYINVSYRKYSPTPSGDVTFEYVDESKLTEEKKQQYAYLSEAEVRRIARAIDEKLGDRFAESFQTTFEPVIAFREALQTVEEANYAIFRMHFDKRVKEALAARKPSEETAAARKSPEEGVMGDLTIEELRAIKTAMIENNTYYSTETAIEGGLLDYWKTENKEGASNQISVTINTNNFQSSSGFPRTFNQVIKELTANVGAIGVTTIHAVDGSVMIRGHILAVLNIYDALLLGTNLASNTAQIQKMNEAFYDVNIRHSILGKAVEKLESMAETVTELEMDPDTAVAVYNDLTRILGPAEEGASVLDSLVTNVMSTLKQTDTARRELAKQELNVNQYAAGGDIKGYSSRVLSSEELGASRFAVFESEDDSKRVEDALTWLVKSVKKGVYIKNAAAKEAERTATREAGQATEKTAASEDSGLMSLHEIEALLTEFGEGWGKPQKGTKLVDTVTVSGKFWKGLGLQSYSAFTDLQTAVQARKAERELTKLQEKVLDLIAEKSRAEVDKLRVALTKPSETKSEVNASKTTQPMEQTAETASVSAEALIDNKNGTISLAKRGETDAAAAAPLIENEGC